MAHHRFGAGLVNGLRLPVLLLLAVLSLPRAGEPGAAAPADPGLERSVVERVNAERRRAGLGALTADAELAELARRHSCAMARRGFFAHTTPDGETMGDRMRQAGLRYAALAENIARITGGEVAGRAVRGWLGSPGHRENMLGGEFTRTGVGACRAGGAVYVTQLFVRPP